MSLGKNYRIIFKNLSLEDLQSDDKENAKFEC